MADNELNSLIGERLRTIRKQKHLTQGHIAECTGKARQTVSLWETGSAQIGIEDLVKYASRLEVPPSYILQPLDTVAGVEKESDPLGKRKIRVSDAIRNSDLSEKHLANIENYVEYEISKNCTEN